MKMRILLVPIAAGLAMSGCAGPLEHRWDDPVYRSIQERFAAHDRAMSEGVSDSHSLSSLDLETLDSLSVEDAIRYAIGQSPSLRAAGYRIDAASGRVIQAGLYPNPSLELGGEAIGSDAGSAGETAYIIEQEIVLGGRLDRARDIAHSDELRSRAIFIAQEYRVAAQVSRAYLACIAAQNRLARREELAALVHELLESTRIRFEAGSATQPDQLRAQVAYEQSQLNLDHAGYEADGANRALALLIGLDESIELSLVTAMDIVPVFDSYDELLAKALESNSQMSLAQLAITRAKQSHQLAQANAIPDLVVSIGPRYSDIDDETTLDLGIGIEIPLFDRNQGEIQATLAERLSVSAQYQSVQLELASQVAQAWSVYQSTRSAVERYQNQLLPMAEQTLELTRQAYQSGKANYLRLLDAQQVMIESQISYIDTVEQLHMTAILLNELSQSSSPWRNSRKGDQLQAEVHSK